MFLGLNVLGDPARGLVIDKSILHEDHNVDVHVLTTDELELDENCLLGVNYHMDVNAQLEVLCSLHGSILTRLDPSCHLVSPVVMVKGGDRPLKIKIIIPHAWAAYDQTFDEVKIFTVTTASGIPNLLPSSEFKIYPRNCIVTTVINRQQIFAVTVMENLKDTYGRMLPRFVNHLPAITCVYAVFCKHNDNPYYISVVVYCAIDLPITRKVTSYCSYCMTCFKVANLQIL